MTIDETDLPPIVYFKISIEENWGKGFGEVTYRPSISIGQGGGWSLGQPVWVDTDQYIYPVDAEEAAAAHLHARLKELLA